MNIIYINTHDTGKMISPYGANVKTINLKKFAEDAVTFNHAFCCGPTCSPSRAALLTGQYPHQNGMLGLAQRGFSLNNYHHHLANFLQSNGYHTCISGIQHEHGWYLDIDEEGNKQLGYEEILTTDATKYSKEDLYLWDQNNCQAVCDWLDQYDQQKPFMLSYGMHSTHRPYPLLINQDINVNYIKPQDNIYNNEQNRKDQAQFMTSLIYADQNFASIIEALKRNNLYEKTIIIFTTDHGVALPFNKCNLTDYGTAISLIIRHPQGLKGIIYEGLFSSIDFFPTICDLLNLKKPNYLVGKSFKDVFIDPSIEFNSEIYAEVNFHTSYEPMRCIRTKRYKYIKYFAKYPKYNLSNIDQSVSKDFLINNGLKQQLKEHELLYDLYFDPNEKNNLINNLNYQDIKQELTDKLYKNMQQTNDPLLNGQLEIKETYKVNKEECIDASSKNSFDYISFVKKE